MPSPRAGVGIDSSPAVGLPDPIREVAGFPWNFRVLNLLWAQVLRQKKRILHLPLRSLDSTRVKSQADFRTVGSAATRMNESKFGLSLGIKFGVAENHN